MSVFLRCALLDIEKDVALTQENREDALAPR
jgi:hypothetical protein